MAESNPRRTPEAQVAEYLGGGDLAALGDLFDEVAPELARLAQRLAPDRASAEDLVQETFLTAIERPGSYDPARPLVPWLLGILAHRAREARRRDRRRPEADRLSDREAPEPDTALADAELRASIEEAVDELPANLRGAVRGRLLEERGTTDVAAELGITPGALRVRLTRGLARLRDALPAGFASVLAPFWALLLGRSVSGASTRSLARVRERVLAEAARRVPSAAGTAGRTAIATAAPAAAVKAGVLMANKKLVAAVGISLLTVTGLRFWASEEPIRLRDATPEASTAALRQPHPDAVESESEPEGSSTLAAGVRSATRHPAASLLTEAALVLISVRHLEGRDLPDDLRLEVGHTPDRETVGSLVPVSVEVEGSIGKARLSLPPGTLLASVRSSLSSTTLEEYVRVDARLVAGEVHEVELFVRGGAALEGVVVDGEDRHVAGARVEAWCDDSARGRAPRVVVADALGRFRLEHLGPDIVVRAKAEGLVAYRQLEGRLGSGSVARGLLLRMGPPAELRGRVLEPGGVPARRARVRADPMPGREPTSVAGVYQVPAAKGRARTNAAGEFVLTGLPAEPCYVEVHHDEFPALGEVATPGGEPVTILLEGGLRLAGRVMDAKGRAVEDAEVSYGPYLADLNRGPRSVRTDAAGRFVLSGLPGPDSGLNARSSTLLMGKGAKSEWRGANWIGVVHPEHAVQIVDPLPPAAEGELLVRLEPALAVVGRVVDGDGLPLVGVRVWPERARHAEAAEGLRAFFTPDLLGRAGARSTLSAEDGSFRIEQLGRGAWILHAAAPEDLGMDLTFPVSAGDVQLELVLDEARLRGVLLRGAVSNARTGEPVREFTIVVQRSKSRGGGEYFFLQRHEVRDPEGRFDFSGTLPGSLTLIVSAPGYAEHQVAAREYDIGEHELDVQLLPSRSLTVEVVDPEGNPFARTSLSVRLSSGAGESWSYPAHGPALVHGLPAELVTFVVNADGARAEFPVDLTLPYDGTLTLVVETVAWTEVNLMVVELTGALTEDEFRSELERAILARNPGWLDVARERGDFAFPTGELRIHVVDGRGRVLQHGRLAPNDAGRFAWRGWDGPGADRPSPQLDEPVPMCSLRWPTAKVTVLLEGQGYARVELAIDPAALPRDGGPVEEAQFVLAFLRRG